MLKRDAKRGKVHVLSALAVLSLASCTLLYTKEERRERSKPTPIESAPKPTEDPIDWKLWQWIGAGVATVAGGGATWKWKQGKGAA